MLRAEVGETERWEGERALMLEGLKVAKCQSGRQLAGSGLDAGHRNDFRGYALL